MNFVHGIRDDQLESVIENIAKINAEQGFITKEQLANAMRDLKLYSFRRDQLVQRLEKLNIVVRTTAKEAIEEQSSLEKPIVKKKVVTRKTNK